MIHHPLPPIHRENLSRKSFEYSFARSTIKKVSHRESVTPPSDHILSHFDLRFEANVKKGPNDRFHGIDPGETRSGIFRLG
jgi:hypothetical protein